MLRRPSSLVLAAIMMAMLLWLELPVNAQTATPTAANLWVGAGGSCTRSASATTYNSATSCSSMQAALTAATGGDTVLILNGTYGGQNLSSNGKTSTVNFYAQTYGSVLLTGGLNINVDHVHVVGVTTKLGAADGSGGIDIEDSAATVWSDVLVDGFHGKNAFIAASGVTVKNSEFGNWNACSGFSSPSCTGNCAIEDGFRFWGYQGIAPQNDKLIDSSIHDVSAPPNGDCGGGTNAPHVDAIQVYQAGGIAQNIVIDGVKFYNNASSAIQAGGASLANWTIQNNYFGQTTCCNNIVWGQANCSGSLIIRNNTLANTAAYGIVNDGGCSGSYTLDFSSNLYVVSAPSPATVTGTVTGGNNVFPSGGGSFGSNAKRCSPSWLNGVPSAANGFDVRLSSSDTCANDAGNPADYAPTDMFGTTRPQGGSSPTAGAFEIKSSSVAVNPPTGLIDVVN